jgi:mannosyltransferase
MAGEFRSGRTNQLVVAAEVRRTIGSVRLTDRRRLAALTIAAAILRFATIDVQSYWFDEALTAKLLRLPLGEMLSQLPDTELTPPLYYVLAWPWAHVVGSDEAALRALSALFGIATVPVAYLAAREIIGSRRAGLATAALVAFNPLLVWYSQEARPYSLLALLGALTLLFCAQRRLWLWALVATLALLTHYFAAFLVVPEALWLAWVCRPRARALMAGAIVGAVGLALIPLAAHERSKIGTGYIEGVSLRRRVIGAPEDFLTGFIIKFDTTLEKVLDAIALAVAAIGVWLAFLRPADATARRGATLAAAAALIAAGVPLLLAIAGADFLNTRNVIVACVPALVVLGAGFGVSRLRALGVVALCAVGLTCVVLVAADTTFQRENWRGIAEALGGAPDGASRAIIVPPVSGEVGIGVQVAGLSRAPAGGAVVREVDVVTPRSTELGGEASGRPSQLEPPGPGFRLAERRYDETFTLVRWVAPTARRVSIAQLEAAARGVVFAPIPLVQRAGG